MTESSFEKKFRLLSVKDFSDLKIGSFVFKQSAFIIYYKFDSSRETVPFSRIGISVTKKIGKAHDRNRLKRIIRESFRKSRLKMFNLDFLVVVSWSNKIANLSGIEKEKVLLKNLNDFENYLLKTL